MTLTQRPKIGVFLAALSLLACLALPASLKSQVHNSSQPRYILTDLKPVGNPPGQAFSITRNGIISGDFQAENGFMHAALWLNQFRFDLGKTYLQGSTNSTSFGANVLGQSVGTLQTATVDPNGEDFCGYKSLGLAGNGGTCVPFVWQIGKGFTFLPTLGGPNGGVNQINVHGQIVGQAETSEIDPGCPAPQKLQAKPVLWTHNKVQQLETVAGDLQGIALAINDRGQIAGASGECALFSPQFFLNLQPLHVLLWEPGQTKPTDLGNLGGSGHFGGNIAFNINNRGEVVGNSDLPGDTANHGFLWTRDKGMKDLGTLPGDVISGALSINNKAQVVGVSIDANFNLRAYIWQNGQMSDLNELIPANANLTLVLACGINDDGQIVGLAVDKTSGDPHAFLLTPKR